MKTIHIYLLLTLLSASLWAACRVKPPMPPSVSPIDPKTYTNLWAVIDSLEGNGLYRSAIQKVDEVIRLARSEGNAIELVSGVVRRRSYVLPLEEDAEVNTLVSLEKDLITYPEPAKSILHAYAARWYQAYLQNNLWRISQQTVSAAVDTTDMRTWDLRQLTGKISSHYLAAIQWPGLKTASVKEYAALLTEEKETDSLRPTLFDILSQEALMYFSTAQAYLAQPAEAFRLVDPVAFAPPAEFVRYTPETRDTSSLTWRALLIFRDLLAFRRQDPRHEAALIDADVLRVKFAFERYSGPDKDEHYIKALQRIIDTHAHEPESTLADHALARYHQDRAAQWSPGMGVADRLAYREAVRVAQAALRRFPGAHGSHLCAQLITDIETPSLQLTAEDVGLPEEEQLARLQYKNITEATFTLVGLPRAMRDWLDPSWSQEEITSRLASLPVRKTWTQVLPDSADYREHATEISIPALPIGHYAVVVEGRTKAGKSLRGKGATFFTLSRIGYWLLQDPGTPGLGIVVDRKTGEPASGVKVECYIPDQDGYAFRARPRLASTLTSDDEGLFTLPDLPGRQVTFRFTRDGDELYPDQGIYAYGDRPVEATSTTMFFTDRAIYRPGQKIFFKGYAVRWNAERLPSVAARQPVSVSFRDANFQEIAVREYLTNEFGTFSGSFDIPQGGSTGIFQLRADFGNGVHTIRVEEYRRPKFEVTFDTLTSAPALGDSVVMTARAGDYAGSALTGARYAYTVKRTMQWPWWWRGYHRWFPGREDEQVLVNAEGLTSQEGEIPVRFQAIAAVEGAPDARYRYEIGVTVTDLSGETHEVFKYLTVSRQGYEVFVDMPEKAESTTLSRVPVRATNAEGKPVEVNVKMVVSELQGPTHIQRERLWDVPDMPVLKDEEYALRFPAYRLPGQQTIDKWPVLSQFNPIDVELRGRAEVDLSRVIRKPGHYKLAAVWSDERGKTLETVQYVSVYSLQEGLPSGEAMIVQPKSNAQSPGDPFHLTLMSDKTISMPVFRWIERRQQGSRGWINADGQSEALFSVSESDRGGFAVHHYAVFDNRFFESHNAISVPWSNKDLDVRLTTWRDKTEPGAEESWTLTVTGREGDRVSAEVLMSMYDASLDAFVPHQWTLYLFPLFQSQLTAVQGSPRPSAWWLFSNGNSDAPGNTPDRLYRMLREPGWEPGARVAMRGGKNRMAYPVAEGAPSMQAAPAMAADATSSSLNEKGSPESEGKPPSSIAPPPLRKALEETVFFFPDLHSDTAGQLAFTFRMKEALTRWKFQALAHTDQLRFGITSAEAVTKKDLMVFPHAPRFFREGDTIAFPVKVTNLSDSLLTAGVSLRIVNALTGDDVTDSWGGAQEVSVTLPPGMSAPASWWVKVPVGWTSPVKYQVSARAGRHVDGEEAWVPVLANRLLVTETMPMPLKAGERRTFTFSSMTGKSSPTQVNERFVVEMTTSPAWYAVQALPYLMESSYDCAEQVFGRYYANRLGTHILELQPGIARVNAQWRNSGDEALRSPLQKNQDLKSAILEETPWVRDALGETQQRLDMALLFDPNRLANDRQQAIHKLEELQLPNGGFPWFKGCKDSWYITQYIVEGAGRLQRIGAGSEDPRFQAILDRAQAYLDSKLLAWYRDIEKRVATGETKWSDRHIDALHAQYVYARSFFRAPAPSGDLARVIAFLREQFAAHWRTQGLYAQGLMALGIHHTWPADPLAATLLASIRERTLYHEELGRYWKTESGYAWSDAPVERQALMIELFQAMNVPQPEVDELRVWLLKQKQTRQWPTTKSTSSAVYALLIHPEAWLNNVEQVTVLLGRDKILPDESSGQAGTGYIRRQWEGVEIHPEWQTISASNPNAQIAWGAAYWQYWEEMEKVKATDDPGALRVTRSLWKIVPGQQGKEALLAADEKVTVGDRLLVRLTLETDRAMEFVHLKDLRAAGMEPLATLSAYQFAGGLGYYQSTRDLATHFFIDVLPRGKYVLSYEVFVTQAGQYAAGMATAQCFYAPEFASHTAGLRIAVQANRE